MAVEELEKAPRRYEDGEEFVGIARVRVWVLRASRS